MNVETLTGLDWIRSSEKRQMDIRYITATLPLSLPLGLGAMAASGLLDKHIPIFTQSRIGQNGAEVRLRKIKTLKDTHPDRPGNGPDDISATKFGRILRRYAIDEIPQIINIARGEMSVAGPRIANKGYLNMMQNYLPVTEWNDWLEMYCLSIPGGVSSYSIAERTRTFSSDEERCLYRVELDKRDFEHTSYKYDKALLVTAVNQVFS